jgi:two-component system, OmpR family, response regulator VicR
MPGQLIMVVEDHPSMLDLFSDILEEEGYRVVLCDAESDAYTRIKSTRPDAVILSLWLGTRTGGWDLCQVLADDPETATIPLIVCTSTPAASRRQPPDLQPHCLVMLDKPFYIEDLLNAIESVVA